MPVDIGKAIEDKVLDRVRHRAQLQARDFLCPDCIDRRCLNDLICKAFLTLTDAFAWEIVAEKSELN